MRLLLDYFILIIIRLFYIIHGERYVDYIRLFIHTHLHSNNINKMYMLYTNILYTHRCIIYMYVCTYYTHTDVYYIHTQMYIIFTHTSNNINKVCIYSRTEISRLFIRMCVCVRVCV